MVPPGLIILGAVHYYKVLAPELSVWIVNVSPEIPRYEALRNREHHLTHRQSDVLSLYRYLATLRV